ncbi:DKNYY domain-containing protein [Patescibacteria group bacterium]|nr:DKNYY domain-containing protein [Patescibacteria group bacterium]
MKPFNKLIITLLSIGILAGCNTSNKSIEARENSDKNTDSGVKIEDSVFSKKNNHVYYRTIKSSGMFENTIYEDIVLEDANADSFELISRFFAKNDKNVFLIDPLPPKKIEGANPKTFIVLEETLDRILGKDDKNVYFYEKVLKDADPKSFRIVNKSYTRDDKTIFYQDEPRYDIDVKSFEVLHWDTVKDKNNVYDSNGQVVEGADPNTFQSYKSTKGVNFFFVDKNYVWQGYGKIEGLDPASFKVICDLTYGMSSEIYIKDKKGVYYNETIIPNADPATFKCTEGSPDFEAEDKKYKYRYGQVVASKAVNWISYALSETPDESVLYPSEFGQICGDRHANEHAVIWLQDCSKDPKNFHYHYPSKSLIAVDQSNALLLIDTEKKVTKKLLDTDEVSIQTDLTNNFFNPTVSEEGKYIAYNVESKDQKNCYKYIQNTQTGELHFHDTYFSCSDEIFWSSDRMGICTQEEIKIASESDQFIEAKTIYTTQGTVGRCHFDNEGSLLFADSIKTEEYLKNADTDMEVPIYKLNTETGKVEFSRIQYTGF